MSNKIDKLLKIYKEIPDANCKGLCVESCSVIAFSPIEIAYLKAAGLEPPTCTPTSDEIVCSALKEGRCNIYEHRPAICRLFGTISGALECKYGCKPDRPLSNAKGKEILGRIAKLKKGPAHFTMKKWLEDLHEGRVPEKYRKKKPSEMGP